MYFSKSQYSFEHSSHFLIPLGVEFQECDRVRMLEEFNDVQVISEYGHLDAGQFHAG